MKQIIHQSRFSNLELALGIVVVCLLGAIGYLVYQLGHNTAAPMPSSTAAVLPSAEASAILTRAKYVINYDMNNHSPDVPQQLHSAGYFTQKLADNITQQDNASPEGAGEDSITCSQAIPDSWSYGVPLVGSTSQIASLLVTGNFSGSGPNQITTSWVKVNGVWQEDSITCPAS
jgi:hypothetical protein